MGLHKVEEIREVDSLPPPANPKKKLDPILAALVRKPNCWFCVGTYDKVGGASAERSRFARKNLTDYEFACRGVQLFARYVGPTVG